MSITTVGVLGCGLMGGGIAQVAAASGYRTIVLEIDQPTLDKGLARVHRFLDDGVDRGKVTPSDRADTLARLLGTTDVGTLGDCDLIVEAVVESADVKAAAYRDVEAVIGPRTILASNTSSIGITGLAARTSRPDRFIGLHFFNPVPVMKLAEITRARTTSDETYLTSLAFARSLGKEPITAPDQPGFIVNRLLIPYLLNAIRAYEQGLGTKEDIDKAMTLGCSHPMGPLTLADFVGLDTTYYIATVMFEGLKDPVFAPPALLKQLVLQGKLGRKSGEGFYRY